MQPRHHQIDAALEIAGRGADGTVGVMASTSAKATLAGAGAMFFGGLTESQISMIVGVAVALLGLSINALAVWLGHRRAERLTRAQERAALAAERLAAAQLDALQRGRDDGWR